MFTRPAVASRVTSRRTRRLTARLATVRPRTRPPCRARRPARPCPSRAKSRPPPRPCPRPAVISAPCPPVSSSSTNASACLGAMRRVHGITRAWQSCADAWVSSQYSPATDAFLTPPDRTGAARSEAHSDPTKHVGSLARPDSLIPSSAPKSRPALRSPRLAGGGPPWRSCRKQVEAGIDVLADGGRGGRDLRLYRERFNVERKTARRRGRHAGDGPRIRPSEYYAGPSASGRAGYGRDRPTASIPARVRSLQGLAAVRTEIETSTPRCGLKHEEVSCGNGASTVAATRRTSTTAGQIRAGHAVPFAGDKPSSTGLHPQSTIPACHVHI